MANLSLCCPYFIGMSEAVQQEASVYDNVEVLVTNADGDVEKLTSDIEDLIAQDVDGIVLSGAFIEAAPAGPGGHPGGRHPGRHGRPQC